jgi:hypothetical protein
MLGSFSVASPAKNESLELGRELVYNYSHPVTARPDYPSTRASFPNLVAAQRVRGTGGVTRCPIARSV